MGQRRVGEAVLIQTLALRGLLRDNAIALHHPQNLDQSCVHAEFHITRHADFDLLGLWNVFARLISRRKERGITLRADLS